MADIYAVFGTLLTLGITYPALLTLWRTIFPDLVQRSQQRLVSTPWKSLGMGCLSAVLASVPALILFALPSQLTQVMAWGWILLLLVLSSMAAAGLAQEIGERLHSVSGESFSPLGAFLRGALCWELAVVFPIIGWGVILPVSLLMTLGAGTSALINRQPGSEKRPAADHAAA